MTLEPHYTISIDAASKLVELKISGMVGPEEAGWMGEELRAAIRTLGPDIGQHSTLYDASGVLVMPKATLELLCATFASAAVRALWARKVAFVVKTMLVRLQIQRIREVRRDIGIFEDRETAIAWLKEP